MPSLRRKAERTKLSQSLIKSRHNLGQIHINLYIKKVRHSGNAAVKLLDSIFNNLDNYNFLFLHFFFPLLLIQVFSLIFIQVTLLSVVTEKKSHGCGQKARCLT